MKSFDYKKGGAKWGRIHLRTEEDIEKTLSAVKKSYELIKEAIKVNEPTGWHAELEEAEEGDNEESTTPDNIL